MNNRNLDTLFQEKLKNFEASPNKRVWGAIEGKLAKKKKRILPIWWFSGGIAALCIVGLFLFPVARNQEVIHHQPVIVTDTQTKEQLPVFEKNVEIPTVKNIEERVVAKQTNTHQKKLKKPAKHQKTPVFIADDIRIEEPIASNNTTKKNFELTKKEPQHKEEITSKKQDTLFKKSILKEVVKFQKDLMAAIDKNIEQEKNNLKNSWSVSPMVGVLKANSFSDTSPIDKNLSTSTIGKNSLSFGVQVAYQINSKWTIQSGIHQQKMTYQNSNILVIDRNISSESSATFDADATTLKFGNNVDLEDGDVLFEDTISTNGNLVQEFGYIEIPLEIKYQLNKGKSFKVQVVTGISSLFLNTNNLTLNTDSFVKEGSVNNLNTVNFSGNLGLDFNYYFDKKWSFHLNPMFKTQLNTFQENSNGFSPFNLGVYTGIKHTF